LKRAAAAGERDLFYLDECGVAPTLPTSYTWAPVGVRPLLRYEAPQGRRVNVLGALAPCGPAPRFVFETRLASEGTWDSPAFLDFVCRHLVGLPAGRAALETLPAAFRRAKPCTVVLDNYGVHHSRAVQAAVPALEALGLSFYYLPAYSPKLNRIEPEWRVLKYDRVQDRSFTTGRALKAAVDQALVERASELAHTQPTSHLRATA